MTTPKDTDLRELLIKVYELGVNRENYTLTQQNKDIHLITLHTQKAKLNTAKDIQKLAEKYDENDPIVDLDSWAVPYGSITNYIAHLTNPTEGSE